MYPGTALVLAVLRDNLRFLHYGAFGASGRNNGPGGAPSRVTEMTAMGRTSRSCRNDGGRGRPQALSQTAATIYTAIR